MLGVHERGKVMAEAMVMTVKEAAESLGISARMVQRLFNSGVLSGFVVGRAFRISRESVERIARGDVPSGRKDHRTRRL